MQQTLLDLTSRLFRRVKVPYRSTLAGLIVRLMRPEKRSVTGRIGHYRLAFDLNEGIQRTVFFGLYEPEVSRLISRLLGRGDVFVDVGAHFGYFSFIASQLVGDAGQVHAFEPIPENAGHIRQGIEDNEIANIKLNQVALGSKAGHLELYIASAPGHSGGATLVHDADRPDSQLVDMMTLDDYLRAESVDRVRLVKVDIEGAEYDAFLGMEQLLSQREAPDVICEIHPYLLGRQDLSPSQVTDFLSDRGYAIFLIEGGELRRIEGSSPINERSNIYCTKDPGRLKRPAVTK